MKSIYFKRIALACSLMMLSFWVFSQQQITNSDFENWETISGSNQEPVNWNSFLTASGTWSFAGGNQIESSTDVRTGSPGTKCARIWTNVVVGKKANGNVTLGRVNMGSTTPTNASNYNFTDTGNSDFNQPLTDYPDSVVFWAKFNPNGHTGNARMKATIHDNFNYRDPENTESSNHVVATAVLNYPSTNGNWQRFSVPFDYSGPATDAQYILLTFTTSEIAGGGEANDEVFIDDVELIYNPVITNEVEIAPVAVQNLIENQTGTTLNALETPVVADSRQWKYATVSGGPYTNVIAGETGVNYTPQFALAGTYYVVVESNFGGDIQLSNEVQINVVEFTSSIAPNAIQNLIENQVGTQLSVTESPSVDSREWKYSLSSGSGYTSFTNAETGLNYTPQFADADTYYVVCASTIDNITVISNEVQINVSEFEASIAPVAIQNLIENQIGSVLTVTENITADTREWKYSTTSGTGYVSFSTTEIGTTYTPLFANSNTYYVVCEATYGGNTVVSNEVQINVSEFDISIAPTIIQDLVENQSGSTLAVTENITSDSREWKYSTTSGTGYVSFSTTEIGSSYTPLFANSNTYYVVCEATYGGNTVISNEVQINVTPVVNNVVSISPNSTQYLIENLEGTPITANELPSPANSRQWKHSTTTGGPYTIDLIGENATSYTPVFATAGDYYVVIESDFGGGDVITSNEVHIVVSEFTNSIAPVASQNLFVDEEGDELTVTETPNAETREWKYSATSGSGYTSFSIAEIGLNYTPQFAIAGTYYVVCESTIEGITITSNEVVINVEEEPIVYSVTIEPAATQNLIENELGEDLTAIEAPTAADSRQWKYATSTGGTYVDLSGETSLTYTPVFADAGTYYVIVESDFDGDIQMSNEVIINVEEEPIVYSVAIEPTATQNLIENQLGDELTATEAPTAADSRQWKFATTSGGTYTDLAGETGVTYAPLFSDAGTYYVVVESDFDGEVLTSNEVIINVEEFIVTIAPEEEQTIEVGSVGNQLTVTESHTVDTRDWKISLTSGSNYMSFETPESGVSVTPAGGSVGTFYVICESTIDGISVISNEVVINVVETSGINGNELTKFNVYVSDKDLNVDFSSFDFNGGLIEVLSMEGKLVAKSKLIPNQLNTIPLSVETGIYNFRISNGNQTFNGKVFVR